MTTPPTAPALRRSLKLITIGGCLAMIYSAGITSPATTDFFRHVGASDFQFGLLGGLPAIMIALQFVGAMVVNRIRRRKALFMITFMASRLVYIPVAFIPLLFPAAPSSVVIPLLLGLVAAGAALSQFGGTSWFSWMADLVPRRVLNSYWGVRQRWMFAAWTVAYLAVSVLLYGVKLPITVMFPLLTTIAVAIGLTDIMLFKWVEEPENVTADDREHLDVLVEPFRHKEYRTFLVASVAESATILLAATFMQIYVIKELQLPLWQVTVIWCVYGIGNSVSAPLWGRLCDRHGCRPVMVICMLFKPLVALLFAFITPRTAVWVLPVFFLADASWNSGMMVARNGYTMKIAPRENRSMFAAAVTAVMGISAGLAAIAGGLFLRSLAGTTVTIFGRDWSNYQALFLLSAVLRAGVIPLTLRIREPKTSPPVQVLNDMMGVWPLKGLRFPAGLRRRK